MYASQLLSHEGNEMYASHLLSPEIEINRPYSLSAHGFVYLALWCCQHQYKKECFSARLD